MNRLFARADHDDPASLQTGYLLTLTSTAAIILASFFRPSHVLSILALVLATVGIAAGLVCHVTVRRAHVHRNARHRAWADSERTGLTEFRADLLSREHAVDELDRSWGLPLGVSFALVLSAMIVPWEMLAPLAPASDVDLLTTCWLVVSLSGALVAAVLSAVAGVRSETTSLPQLEHEDA
ncbi:hypothetical protein [Solicola sp. PLA-1-18]|uniref:hypothetical protein n=1 Tax=Solicola sp. PLA-1-18 TaxID=3380532 RepID=UPI003B80A263